MVKVKKRSRGIIYLDSIDLEILEFIEEKHKANYIAVGVLELVEKMNISHISLKPHIDKLLYLDLITTREINEYDKKGNIKKKGVGLSTINGDFRYYLENVYCGDDDKYLAELKKKSERYETILNFLQQIRSMLYDVEKNKLLEIDLRKIETQDKFKKVVNIKKVTSKK